MAMPLFASQRQSSVVSGGTVLRPYLRNHKLLKSKNDQDGKIEEVSTTKFDIAPASAAPLDAAGG